MKSGSVFQDQGKIIRAMNRPETYPHRPRDIVHLQTYISHIFLTGGRVYKIKKPVKLDFLDFSTLSRRRYYCLQEVALNRRLAREIYLGVSRITLDQGRPVLNGKGPVLEYAVVMREMPQDRMMNRLLREGRVKAEDIRALIGILVPFYQQARTGKSVDLYGRTSVWIQNTEENFRETLPFVGDLITPRRFAEIARKTRSFLEAEEALFRKRIREGYIRDGHGDLHSANICLAAKPIIYDCIEFNHRFRYTDIACDLAFLAMDLDFHGRPDLSSLLQQEYVRRSGDHDFLRLFGFYKTYRAYVRGKVHALSSLNNDLSPKEKNAQRRLARKYFALAHRYARGELRPHLWVVFGLMGSGKSTLAQALHQATGWTVIASDATRKALAGLSALTRRWEPFEKGIYSRKITARTYRLMRDKAQGLLRQGRSVILDGSYKRQRERLTLLRLARRTHARIRFLYCRASVSLIRKRLTERIRAGRSVSDGRWELFGKQRKDFDPILEPVLSHVQNVSTARPAEEIVLHLLRNLDGMPHEPLP